MHKKERHFYAGLLNWFHLFIDIFIFSYLFIFPVYYDFYLIWFIFFQALHWLALKNECILSYTEKRLIHLNYNLGDKISYIPHEKIFYFNNDILIFIKYLLILTILFYIYCRNKTNIKYLLIFEIVVIIYILICKYIDKNHPKKLYFTIDTNSHLEQ
jgi:hypothetical protein